MRIGHARSGMKQSGFSLVTAIFLLVVIGALGMFAMTLSTTQHQSDAMDVMGKRAYQAARTGIEWAAFQIIQSNVAVPPLIFASSCQAATGYSSQVALTGALASFSPVAVRCTAVSAVDAVSAVVYTVSASAATAGATVGSADYIERQISVSIVQ